MTELFADRILRADVRQIKPGADFFKKSFLDHIRERLQTAKRLVFAPSACKAIADIVCNQPVEIARSIELARPPFEPLWLELPLFADHWRDQPPWGEGGGFLIDRDFAQGVNELPASRKHWPRGMIHPSWDRYHLNTTWPRQEQDEFFRSFAIDDWRGWSLARSRPPGTWQAVPDEPLRQILDQVSIDLCGASDRFMVDMREKSLVQKVTLGGNYLFL